jgi:Carbohydrate esterase, sialic acid-specific acetylesterase
MIRFPFSIFLGCLAVISFAANLAAAEPATALPPRGKFHLYLLMGQSNMAGRDRSKLAEQVDNPLVLARTADGTWAVARDPLHQKDGRTEPGAGPGIPFATAMLKAAPGITIGLVPCAVGGSPLRRWEKGGDLYQRALERAKAAEKDGVIKGVIWLQGESDTGNPENAASYEERALGMFRDLRRDLGNPVLPVVVGQIGEFLTKFPDRHPHAETVRAAIRRIPTQLGHAGYADAAGLGHQGDHLHYDAAAAKELGARFARAMTGL